MTTVKIYNLTMDDGSVLPVRTFAGEPGRPAVLCWPGFGIPAGYFDKLAAALNDRGYQVLSAELRGGGDATPKPSPESRWDYRTLATEDHPKVSHLAATLFGPVPQFLLCHSISGQIAAMFLGAAAVGDVAVPPPAGLILGASQSPYFRGYPTRKALQIQAVGASMAATARRRGYWPGTKRDPFGPQSGPFVRDWAGIIRTGRFPADYDAKIAASTTPVYAFSIAGDDDAPPSALRQLTRKFASAAVEITRIPVPLGHSRWIRDCDEPVALIDGWITAAVSATR